MVSDTAILKAHDLKRVYQTSGAEVHAVRGVSLVIEPTDFIGLLGPSGCGKSTLLSIIGLLESFSAGSLVFDGIDIQGVSNTRLQDIRRSKIGFVFQAFNLLSTLTVEENVMLPCILVGMTEGEARSRALELLERLGLGARSNVMPSTLSGGEMQRVAVARAVAHRPRIILADEPTGNLDSVAGESVLNLLAEVHQTGTPVVMVTHSDLAAKRCSKVLQMRDGVLVDA